MNYPGLQISGRQAVKYSIKGLYLLKLYILKHYAIVLSRNFLNRSIFMFAAVSMWSKLTRVVEQVVFL